MKPANQDECVLCCREITIYAMGFCDHPVCYECSARMRVLCETNECPICRSDMPLVVFALQIEPYADISKKFSLFDKQYKILFENEKVRTSFNALLLNNCQICDEQLQTFQNLKDHMRRKHEQHYCDLCTDNLKIFTFERKSYNRRDLARHKIKGDPDQTSHRGHPLCEFCDMRYVDNDDLFRHLRREHFFCHFCDADGKNHFYKDYEYLKTHFRASHFLCEEGNCANEQFTSAFRTEIDLKAHKATQHSKSMSKAEARQARTLEFEFNYVPHARPTSSSSPRGRRFAQQRRNNLEEQNSNEKANSKKEPEAEPLDTQSTQEFPYLSDDVVNGQTLDGKPPVNTMLSSLSLQSFGRNAPPAYRRSNLMCAEDFPALGSASSTNSSEITTSQNYSNDLHNNNNNSNNSTKLTSLSAYLSKKNSNQESAKISKLSSEKKSQPKWIAKRDSSNFEENFPELNIKRAPLTNSASVAAKPSTQNYISAVSTQQNAANEEPSNTEDQFVVIKSKPKKKKQNKTPQTSEDDTLTALLTSINRESKLKNQENEDPFKTRLLHPSETPKPVYKESDTWEKEVHFGKDDFPPLEVMGKPPPPPPGLNIKKSRVPPGFKTNANISTNSSLTLSSIARMFENNFQNTFNTQKENGVLDPSNSFHVYQEPPNFMSRNEKLIERINEVSGNQRNFMEFKKKSREFRCNNISAAEYYDKCLEILGEHGFQEIFPELVSLLPDVPKQQELLAVHKEYLGQQNSTIKQKNNSKSKIKISLTSCSSCNQVLSAVDHESHRCVL